MGAVLDTIKNRRSIRKYKADEIPKEKLEQVLEAANWAPSNGNMQSWSFVVTKGEAVKKVCKVFSDAMQEYIPKATYIPEEQKAGMLKYAENFGGAPMHIIVSYDSFEGDDEKTEKSMQAACAAVQNIMLAAWEEGLGTVWISGEVCTSPITREVLGLNKNQEIAAIVPIGYPAESPAGTRDDVSSKTKWIGFD